MAKEQRTTQGNGEQDRAVAEAGSSPGEDTEAAAASAGTEESPQDQAVAELERELEQARQTAAEHWDDLLRARAELDNLRKRAARDVENAHKHGLERFMNELLSVRDSMELGLSASDGDEVDPAKVREGLELTLKLFDVATEKFGLVEVNPQGEPFDPEFHQAMSMQESEEAESGTVIEVVQKGYLLKDRLLRAAMVIVAK